MHLPVPKAGLIGLSALFALVAAAAVFMHSTGGEADAATYSPTASAKFCNGLSAVFPASRPGSPDATLAGSPACAEGAIGTDSIRDITVQFDVPGGDSNFGSAVVTNTPANFTAADAAIADGTKVGGLASTVTLGLLGGSCSTVLTVEFILFDSTTTGSLAVAPEGTSNRWSSIVDDAAPSPAGDISVDGFADSNSPFVTGNPSIYNTLFTPSGGSLIPPLARYTGATQVNGDWQLLSFFQVTAGALDAYTTNASDEPHIFGRVSHAPTTGTLSLSILNDPTAVQISVSPIHDFCSPLAVQTMLLGTTSGGTRYRTPATAGTMGISQFSYSQRDAENDGIENQFDTCPFTANTGDTDGDGIDNSCDPTPGTNTNTGDHDADGFANRQDNCPITSNGGAAQRDNEADPAVSYLTVAPDGGPKSDGLGDACDADDLNSVTGGAFVQAYNLDYKCIGGGTDADGDGICSTHDINDASACPNNGTKCGWTSINVGMDVEYKNSGGTSGDHGDRAGGNLEMYWGSNPTGKCGGFASWPYDLAGGNSINIGDVLALKPVFGGSVPTVDAHFDLGLGKSINIGDVLALKPVFGLNCTP